MPKYKNGSFKVNVPILSSASSDINFVNTKDINYTYKPVIVNPLSQSELAEGWNQVIPPPRRKNIYLTRNGRTIMRKKQLYNYFKIDLSKLPENLWHKLQPVYEENIYSYTTAKDKRFIYIVNPTVVDDEIRELVNLMNQVTFDSNRAMELLQVLQDNDIHGWVVLRAKNMIGNQLEVL